MMAKRLARMVIGVAMSVGAGSGAVAQSLVSAPAGFVPQQAVSYGATGTAAVAVDPAHPLPVTSYNRSANYADRSGTIAAANIAQTLAGANTARIGFAIQNLSTGDLWITSLGTASAGSPSFRIAPGQLYEFPANGVPATALSILGGSAGQAFAAREW